MSGCLVVFAVFPVVGCEDHDASSEPVSKDQFVSDANAICAEGSASIDAAVEESDLGVQEAFYEIVIPGIREQVSDIRGLGLPEGDEDELEAILEDTEAVLDELEADPETFGTGPNPFADVNQRMAAYGLTTCAGA